MSRKIVGLDIGSHSVKVAVVRERFGRVDLLQFHERPVADKNVQELIRSIFLEEGLHPDLVVSSIPGNTVSVHYLQIPFSDASKISQVVPYEVESIMPFPLEEMVIDQFILSKGNGTGPGNGSSICVALIKKDSLQSHIDALKGAYIEPKIIELESLALYHAFMQWHRTEDTVSLLDIGASRSNLCIVSKGKPQYVRTFNSGGNRITSLIQEALGISFDEAEKKKISMRIIYEEGTDSYKDTFTDSCRGSAVFASLNGSACIEQSEKSTAIERSENSPSGLPTESEQAALSTAIRRGLTPLLIDLKQSLHAYEFQQNERITKLYIAGGGARLSNIDKLLGSELGIEVEHLSIPKDIAQKLTGGEDRSLVIPTGMGLALRGARKKHVLGLNFRKGEYFYKKEAKEAIGRLAYAIVALIVAIMLGSLDFYSRYHYREAKYSTIKEEIRNVYMETFPEAKNVVDEIQQTKTAVDELKKRVIALGGGTKGGVTSLDLLSALTEKIPGDINLNIDDLMIDKTRIKVQGDTNSFENVERIKREFETIPFFKKVDVSDAKLAADQDKVKFRMIIDM